MIQPPDPVVDIGSDGSQPDPSGGSARLATLFRTALIVVPVGVIGNILFSLLFTDRAILAEVAQLPRGYLALALGLGIVPWITGPLRLQIWTRFLGYRVGFVDALEVVLATDLGSAVSPTAVGGGFFRWGMLVQRGMTPGAAASLTALAPIEDGVFFAIALPIAIIYTASWGDPVFASARTRLSESGMPVLIWVAVGLLVVWLAVRMLRGGVMGRRAENAASRVFGRLRDGIRRTWSDAREVYQLIGKRGKTRFALSLTLTGIQWTARYSIISALVAFLGIPVQPVLFWLLQWVVFTLAAVIPTPGAVGGAEAAFFTIYSAFLPAEVIGLATAGWRFFTFYLLLLIAAIMYLGIGAVRRHSTGGGANRTFGRL